LPLLDAGWEWSQGRLMGVALALPRGLEHATGPEEEGLFRALSRISTGGTESLEVSLRLPGGQAWQLRREAMPDAKSLRPDRYVVGVARTGDPARAGHPGTSSLEVVLLRGENGTSAGIASGDQLKKYGAVELRSEIRTLVGDRSEPEGAVTADALRLDGLLRAQLAFDLTPLVRLGPEAAFGLGLRRDAVEFTDHSFAAANRVEMTGDIGVAGRVSTAWKDGIASLGAADRAMESIVIACGERAIVHHDERGPFE
jgi:hypothetical protein